MDKKLIAAAIEANETALGIELGSTRIKSVLIGKDHKVLATGIFNWENRLENGLWTYHLEDAVKGLRDSYSALKIDVKEKYGVKLCSVGAIGISGMMHGHIALDAEDNQLAPFLTWRNTNTQTAADTLTELFQFNVPLRWSISHLYQAVLEDRPYVKDICHITTLAGYVHLLLTGEKVMGVGEASGMFPIDPATMDYDQGMIDKLDALLAEKQYPWNVRGVLPKVLLAGDDAGELTAEGALLLDPEGDLKAGIPMVPPEGDAGTGMTATNSVGVGTGNVSAGTSIFSMVVLEKNLSRLYKDIDMVTTPSGKPVAMVHCNNGSSELDAWVRVFGEFLALCGETNLSTGDLYRILFEESLDGDADCDDVILYNYLSGEPVTGLSEGRPMLIRRPESKFTLANFMRSHIYGIMASLAVGMRILTDEKVEIRRLTGHGGIFKTPGVAQRYMAASMNAPITVMANAGEGGPYGMALLAAYKLFRAEGETLEDYLENRVFADAEGVTLQPLPEEVEGYKRYLDKFCSALKVQAAAVENL